MAGKMEKYSGYVGAPYNFVGISQNVNWRDRDRLQPHNVIDPELKSGRILYEMEALTPIFVSDGKKDKKTEEFYRNCYGNYAIPGSTVRGLVRSNVQILSRSSVADDIQDVTLMYREVANGKEKDFYNTILGNDTRPIVGKDGKTSSVSVLKNVKAGYITMEGGQYTIRPSVVDSIDKDRGEMNYYIASERKIMEGNYKGFEELRDMELQHLNVPWDNKDGGPFRKVIKGKGENQTVHYIGTPNNKKNNPNFQKYRPYICEVYYLLKGIDQVVEIHPAKGGEGKYGKGRYKKGWLLSSGPMNEKKVIYVIPEMDEEGERIPIPSKDIDSYRRDYEGKKNQVETIDKSFFRLPQEGETKPVFYIRLNGRLYFGFTPRLRLFYKKSIMEGLSSDQKKGGVDYAKSLFGYSDDKDSYKSRLSFMDAELKKDQRTTPPVSLILGGPKPTSYLDYLKGKNNQPVSYNDDEFELRGVKQYWLKEDAEPGIVKNNEKVATRFRPYNRGAVFQGEIRFSNLTSEELGLVLWGLLLEEGSNQNIGKGKPYGYGRIQVRLTGLKIQDQEAFYNCGSFCMDPYKDETSQKDMYISAVKEELSRIMRMDIMKDLAIRDFFLMKDSGKIPSKNRTGYMDIEKNEYRDRVNKLACLPGVEDVVKGRPVMAQERGNGGFGGGQGNSRPGNNRGQGKGDFCRNGRSQGGGKKGGSNGGSKDYSSGGSAGTSLGDLLGKLNLN